MSNVDLSQLVRGKSCTILCHIFNNGSRVSSFALADTGANALALIDTLSAQAISQFLSVPTERLPNPIVVQGFNGADAPLITSILQVHICVDKRRLYNIPFLITDLGGHDIILGRKWMSYLRVVLDIRRRRIVWPGTLPPTPYFAKEISIPMKDLFYRPRNPRHQEDVVQREHYSTEKEIATLDLVQILPRPKPVVQPELVDCSQLGCTNPRAWTTAGLGKHTEQLDHRENLQKMERQFRTFTDQEHSGRVRKPSASYPAKLPKIDICVIGTVGFSRSVSKPGATVFVTSLYEIDRILEERTVLESDEDRDYRAQVDTKLPTRYREFSDVFSKEAADRLLQHRLYDHRIELEASPETLGFCLLY